MDSLVEKNKSIFFAYIGLYLKLLPFIIDTHYASIEETHRNNITSEYLSTISDQVIILSTNTEIDEKAYREIKPKLNGEYLIQYDDKNRKTIQREGYFFEV